MKLLDETDALVEIGDLLSRTQQASLAVAFWGTGAIQRLGLERTGLSLRILCNLDSGACNPAELRRIRDIPGVTLKAHAKLHAKVYWTPTGAVLGSSNASSNGLAIEGDAAGAWAEANVRLNDPKILEDIANWFDTVFSEGYTVTDVDLLRAEHVWAARKKIAPPGARLNADLLTSFRNAPDHPAWKQIKLVYWMDDLDEEEEAWLEAERTTGSIAKEASAYGHFNDQIAAGDWLLDFDLSSGKPLYGGTWKAMSEGPSHDDLRIVYETPTVDLPGFGQLAFSKSDGARFAAIAPTVLSAHSDDGRSSVIDLATAISILEATPTATDEKLFTAAMEKIWKEAVAVGYNPTVFRRMLADHGGVETARRLIYGNATSGFTTLWERGRLDLSVEALVLQPQWQQLFSAEELKIARNRLKQYKYVPNP